MDPIGLNACARFNRRAALAGSPNCAMNGFDAVSRNDSPLAITNNAARKNPYLPTIAAGQNRKAPRLNSPSPTRKPDLYPNLRITSAAGMASRK